MTMKRTTTRLFFVSWRADRESNTAGVTMAESRSAILCCLRTVVSGGSVLTTR
jgi:hypothetical protein